MYTPVHVPVTFLKKFASGVVSFSLPLVGVAVLQAIVYVFFVRAVDLYEREPVWYVIPVFVWGFTVAVGVSLLFNTLAAVAISAIAGAQVASLLTAVFVAPVVEELGERLRGAT